MSNQSHGHSHHPTGPQPPRPQGWPGTQGWPGPRHRQASESWQQPGRQAAPGPTPGYPALPDAERAPGVTPAVHDQGGPAGLGPLAGVAGGAGPATGHPDRSGLDVDRSRRDPGEVVWPHPDVAADAGNPPRWRPVPQVAAMISPLLRNLVTSRLVTATAAHADHALQHLGDRAAEPGPHALLLISAEPHPTPALPQRPPWWQHSDHDLHHDLEPVAPTPTLRIASRLVAAGDGDDLLDLLDRLTHITRAQLRDAYTQRRLYALLGDDERAAVAACVDRETPWQPAEPYPYADALAQGLLWDPRTPLTGLAPTSTDPLTADTVYLGVAVTTLDTPTTRWTGHKYTWRSSRDPDTGLPVTACAVPGTAFAVLDDGTAIAAHRIPRTARQPRSHTAVSNARIERDLDRHTQFEHRPWLVDDAPPQSRHPQAPAQASRELWDRLGDLHVLLRTAFGYQAPS